ncbi:MAG: methionyl-tRNA formyltransferase [Gammaproteobacteria bacterium]|nr:methionyl-tRNA formyltransferase [Gammaproteobacteria bacterium]MDH3373416.1 methionyl-tRNA formyltransferase [Gammaproteobacteria bacterium]MDH3408969.1 methionyl-tRNA formyltransferase [Gammaproteobacteria bacterium]MDH3551083.1 methionyl-tRNA formyltransferase [Gammaproteobacteria bacterium]
MTNPKIIFAGTPEFAVASLRALVDTGAAPCAVLTQPDRRAGRGKRLQQSPVKHYALEQGITVKQPSTLRDDAAVAELVALKPDLIVVAAYGLILPQKVLDIPLAGCLNVHASLLPRWRGAAPIQAAILAGDKETGTCLMAMEAGLDTGPVYACDVVSVGEYETAGELHDRLAASGAGLLVRHLGAIIDGTLTATEQDEDRACYAPKISADDAIMDWRRRAVDLERQVRAYNPVPGAWFMLDDERIKCWKARRLAAVDVPPGTVVAVEQDGIVISCGEGALRLESLQRPGRRAITAAEFAAQIDLRGRRL